MTDTKVFLAYVVPEVQPAPSSQAEIYGGYHITLFPSHTLPADYSIVDAVKTFKTSRKRWELPADSKLLRGRKQRLNFIGIQSRTLSKLMDHLQAPEGVWDPEMRWDPLHVTLGSSEHEEPVDAVDLYDIFMDERRWYIQLVEKRPLVAKPEDPWDYEYIWLPDQRVRLYRAA